MEAVQKSLTIWTALFLSFLHIEMSLETVQPHSKTSHWWTLWDCLPF